MMRQVSSLPRQEEAILIKSKHPKQSRDDRRTEVNCAGLRNCSYIITMNSAPAQEEISEMRTCTGPCGETKPLIEFYFRDKTNNIRYWQCKDCWNNRTVQWRLDNPEKFSKAHEKRRADGRRRRYRLKGILKKFGLTLEWYDRQMDLQGGKCACCEVEMDEVNPSGKPGRRGHMWPTIPCVHHSHSHGDVYDIICNACNVAEGYLRTPERALKLAQYMERDALFYSTLDAKKPTPKLRPI